MPNDTNGLLRPHYFERQQLRAADLTAGQDYLRHRLRRHNRFLHGWGVVCGAEVSLLRDSRWEVHVSEGYVLTPHGDEVYIPPDILPLNLEEQVRECLGSPSPCPDPTDLNDTSETQCVDFRGFDPGTTVPNPRVEQDITFRAIRFDGDPAEESEIARFGDFTGLNCNFRTEILLPAPASLVELTLAHFSSPVSIEAFNADESSAGTATMSGPQNQAETLSVAGSAITRVVVDAPQNEAVLLEFCRASVGVGTVYLVVCPDEQPVCPQPAVPANCQPPGGDYAWSRMRETYRLQIECCLPDSHQEAGPTCDELEAIVCGQAHVACPPSPEELDNCVVLATLDVSDNGISAIDDLTDRRQLLSGSLMLAHLHCRCETVEVECVDFEDLPLNATFNVGDSFVDSGVTVTGQTFFWSNDEPTDDGFARIEDGGLAGGSGQEAQVNNINLAFDFDSILPGLTVHFGEFGGNLNLEVNGDMRNFENFAQIDGDNIGGVDVSIIAGASEVQGTLALQGEINSFAIGGQELWIDDVCPSTAATVPTVPPSADFIAQPISGTVPLTVSFTDQSSGEITAWTWSFGDGRASSQQNPVYIYQEAGSYTATLTVTGPGGTDTASGSIAVSPERSILRIAPTSIEGSRFTVTEHRVRLFGQGLADATTVEFADGANAVANVVVTGRSEERLDLRVVLRRNPVVGARPFTILFEDGTGLFSESVQLEIRVGFVIDVAGETFAIELDDAEFDLDRGREASVEAIGGIGGARGGRLREAGAGSVLALATLPPERVAEIAEVTVAMATRWRDEAREMLRR